MLINYVKWIKANSHEFLAHTIKNTVQSQTQRSESLGRQFDYVDD